MNNKNIDKVLKKIEALEPHWQMQDADYFSMDRIARNQGTIRLWSVPRTTGKFLRWLVVSTSAKKILELGTSAGYSTLWLAKGAKETKGNITTIECFEPKIRMAQKNFREAKTAKIIRLIHGKIKTVLRKWNEPLDFVFIDADKENYLEYAKQVEPHLKKGGILVADNATNHANYLQGFLSWVSKNKRFESMILPMDNGILIAVKK